MADESATGKVTTITTKADGTTEVTIQDKNTNETFKHPRDMTDKQLEEFKRAQNHDRVVGVGWDEGNGDARPIDSVIVFGADQSRDNRARTGNRKRR